MNYKQFFLFLDIVDIGGEPHLHEQSVMANLIQDVAVVAKKKQASKTWMLLDDKGETMMLEVDKYAIMHRVGIHARDLRILDPLLSYPSTILGRERAIVLNLEVRILFAILSEGNILVERCKGALLLLNFRQNEPLCFTVFAPRVVVMNHLDTELVQPSVERSDQIPRYLLDFLCLGISWRIRLFWKFRVEIAA